jgi:hypothetical protein
VVAQGGTSIIGSSDAVSVVSTPRFSEWGGNAGAGGLGGLGTLLGPEGAGDCFFSDCVPAGFGWWGGRTSGIDPTS